MDRQLAKLPSNEQPSSSRHVSKSSNGRLINKDNISNRNGFNRFQCKTRNRENKSSFFKNVKNNQASDRDYLTPKITLAHDVNYQIPKKHHGKNGATGFVKERFVQANCQFVISGQHDYSEHLKNPDLSISWDSIEEVIFTCKNDDELYCPICLHYPTAAKITRCGHIYCWPCVLHYLSLSDKKSRSCPICFHNINKLELKSVTILKKKNHLVNDYLTFNLMKIRKGSTLAVPFVYKEEFEHSINVKHYDESLDVYHKLFITSKQQQNDLFQREFDELNRELLEYQNENMPEICFVENALEELTKIKTSLDSELHLDESLLSLKPSNDDLNDYTYFYQSEDGQHIYLHSINIRMLKYEYQELKYCPLTISGKIIELHRQTVTEDIRKRFAHLRHLPLSCEFTIAELEFDTSVVSKETLDEFNTEIKNRKKERKRKETAQNIRDRNIEIENNKKFFNLHPLPDFNINLEKDFPVYQIPNEEEFASGLGGSPAESSPSTSFQSSFANMLAAGSSHFDGTVRKKISPPQIDADAEQGTTTMDTVTLSDYFEQCIKISNKKSKRNKKK